MIKPTTMKSLSLATAVAAALAFGTAGYAQTAPANDSKQPMAVTGSAAKTMEQRDDAKMSKKSTKAGKMAAKKADAMSTQGTNSGASKTGDMSMPKEKGDGSGKS